MELMSKLFSIPRTVSYPLHGSRASFAIHPKISNICFIILDGAMTGIAFDWITANLYGVSEDGYVFACKSSPRVSLSCVTILSRPGRLYGIAVDPNQG